MSYEEQRQREAEERDRIRRGQAGQFEIAKAIRDLAEVLRPIAKLAQELSDD